MADDVGRSWEGVELDCVVGIGLVQVVASARGRLKLSCLDGSTGKEFSDEVVPKAPREVLEEWKVGLIGSSERDRDDNEGNGSVDLGSVSTFAHGKSAFFSFGESIGEAFPNRRLIKPSESRKLGLRGKDEDSRSSWSLANFAHGRSTPSCFACLIEDGIVEKGMA